MIIYKCDVCDKLSEDDVLPSDWAVLQVHGPQGTESINMRARHLCNNHTIEKLLQAAK